VVALGAGGWGVGRCLATRYCARVVGFRGAVARSLERNMQAPGARIKESNPISEELVAPCGMNCAICSRYLAYVNNLKRSQCIGCRPRGEACEYLFEKCTGINHTSKGNPVFCFECDQYPCKQINRMDARYRKNYGMSVKDNLESIHQTGIEHFVDEQYQKHRCSRCGGLISIHNRKCFECDTVTRLIEKRDKQY
jgi:hypothetical protein